MWLIAPTGVTRALQSDTRNTAAAAMIDLNEDPPPETDPAEQPAAYDAATDAQLEASPAELMQAETHLDAALGGDAAEPPGDAVMIDGQQADADDDDEEARDTAHRASETIEFVEGAMHSCIKPSCIPITPSQLWD